MTASSGHYFDDDPSVASAPHTVQLVLEDLTVALAADAGVFSADAIDVGTRYLLMSAPTPEVGVGNVLDLGCGYGPMARVLAHRCPTATVWAIDVNARARALASANLEGFDANVSHPDEVPADVRFDLIWSNPPIRIGKAALHALLSTWLDRLTPQGQAVLVVQRHLGADSLARWLEERGHAVERIGSRRGYRLLTVTAR